jgi:hypothetical protein
MAHTARSGLRKEKVLNERPAARDVNDEDVLLFKDVFFKDPQVARD